MDNMQDRQRLKYIEAIRFFAVLLVVIDHFNASLVQYDIMINGNSIICPSAFPNVAFGTLGVSLFFIISGVSLYYNYGDDFNVHLYFKKRFVSIYPQFWCSYVIVFLIMFFKYKEFRFEVWENIPTSRFILSMIGMDGYFLYRGRNFYLIGEWFLGCIILLYILFPLLRICVKKQPLITGIVALIIYVMVVMYNPFEIGLTRNLLIRGVDFLFGMMLVRYLPKGMDKKSKSIVVFICFVVLCFSTLYMFSGPKILMVTCAGISFFLLLAFLFENVNVYKVYFIKVINKYAYNIFLCHHVVLSLCFEHFKGHRYSLFEGITLVGFYVICLCVFIKINVCVKNSVCDFIKQQRVLLEKVD